MLNQQQINDVCKAEELFELDDLENYANRERGVIVVSVMDRTTEELEKLAWQWYQKVHKLSEMNGMGPCTVGHQAKQTMVGYFRHKGWKFREVVETDFKLECIPPSTFNRLATNLYIPNAKGISVEDRIQILIFSVYELAKEEGWVDPLNLFV